MIAPASNIMVYAVHRTHALTLSFLYCLLKERLFVGYHRNLCADGTSANNQQPNADWSDMYAAIKFNSHNVFHMFHYATTSWQFELFTLLFFPLSFLLFSFLFSSCTKMKQRAGKMYRKEWSNLVTGWRRQSHGNLMKSKEIGAWDTKAEGKEDERKKAREREIKRDR